MASATISLEYKTLDDLLRAEDDPELLAFSCPETGLPYWPQIRLLFMRMAISDLLYATPLRDPAGDAAVGARAFATLTRSISRCAWMWAARRGDVEVCIFSAGVGNQRVDGKWFNRLSDHFALDNSGRTLTVEEHFEWQWPSPRMNTDVFPQAPLQALTTIAGRLRLRALHLTRAQQLVELVSARARRCFGWRPGPERERQLVQTLARKAAAIPVQYKAYEAFLRRFRPRVLLVLGGSYGPASALMAAGRRLGIVTAEYQHGVIAAGHDAYNFAPTIRNSEAYRQTLPEYFLSYGEWWNGQVNTPLKMTVIGNPHRTARLQGLAVGGAKDMVLVLSDGTEFEIYLRFATEIALGVRRSGFRVVLRPHPVERSKVLATYQAGAGAVQIDEEIDLYKSLASAYAVVSELSTALFEAAGIADRLFVWDTAKAKFMFPHRPFQTVDSAAALVELLNDESAGVVAEKAVQAIWAEPWKDRYHRFLEDHGVHAC